MSIRDRIRTARADRGWARYRRDPDRFVRRAAARDRHLSWVPAVRQRINPVTGRPRWTDRNEAALDRWVQTCRPPVVFRRRLPEARSRGLGRLPRVSRGRTPR